MLAEIDLYDLRSFVEIETDLYYEPEEEDFREGYYMGVQNAIEKAQEYVRLQMMGD